MSNNLSNNEILDKIRDIGGNLANVKLSEVLISKQAEEITFGFICNRAVSDEDKEKAEEILKGHVPERFSITVDFKKIVADKELVKKSITEFVKSEFMSVSPYIGKDAIKVNFVDEICDFTIFCDDDVCRYAEANNIIDKICDYLEQQFCITFTGGVSSTGKTEADVEILKDNSPIDLQREELRTYTVKDVVRLWGEEITSDPVYIEDAKTSVGSFAVAGKITAIGEKLTKTGKTYYVVELDDTTGKISGKVFMTKEKLSKIQKLQVGSPIIVMGDFERFNGAPSLIIKDVSYCEFPEKFDYKEKASKPVPSAYKLIFPEPLVEYSQSDLFSMEKPVPECLIGKTFVVVDIETTGVKYFQGDKITEIGAVKICDGKITEKFQTLINPQVPISEEITSLTGIDDKMVKDKPLFGDVLPDFYKFCYGSYIVAHNIEFDYQFIKYMAKDSGYVFKNEGIDTWPLAISVLPHQKNYKLNTLCDYFGIKFEHHRALSDAHATAKLFLELISIKKSL